MNTCFSDTNSTYINISTLQENLPQPKGKKKKKKKAKEDDPTAEGGDSPDGSPKKKKKKKKKRVDKDIPEVPPMQYGPEQSVFDAIKRASSWQSCNTIQNKFSQANLSTTEYAKKVTGFNKLNTFNETSPVWPQSQYLGQDPSKLDDPYTRRKVK